MSLKLFEARSIASQLVLLFTLAATLLLCFGLGVLYWIVIQHAHEEDSEVLADKIFAVRTDLRNLRGPAALNDELKMLRAGERMHYWVRVVDSIGGAVAETPGMDALLPRAVFPQPGAAERLSVSIEYETRGQLFGLISANEEFGGRRYTIEVAQDRTMDERFERKFGALLMVVLLSGTLAAAITARIFTRHSLRPLAEMTQSFKRIGPKRLDERVPPAGWPRELQPLAVAYDDMLDRLENSFTRLSQFSADLAHELRTPIANLRGEAEVALTRSRTPEEYREVIESNVGECERLSGIIDNLLFLARAEAADGPVAREHFDGRAALEKIAGYYETMAEERRITITCAGVGGVFADPLLFGRAVSNLVDNAVRHSPDGGPIDLALAVDKDCAKISVKDRGVGMAAEHLPRVFDRFYRVDSSRSSEGTGLGLALVKSIMDLHVGSAEVESEAGRGTTVTLNFPHEAKTVENVR